MQRRHLLAVLGLPLLSVAALAVYLLIIRSRLPDPVAVHWGPAGEADGFVSPGALLLLYVGLSLAVAVLLAGLSLGLSGAVGAGPLRGIGNAVVWFIGALAVATTLPQLDGDPLDPLPGWFLAVAAVVALAGWGLAMAVGGPEPIPASSDAPGPSGAERLALDDAHTALWHGRTPLGRGPLALAVFVAVLNVGLSVALSWWLLTIAVPLVALVLGSTSYRVTVGPRALDVSGRLAGYPRVRVPLGQIARADAGTVSALRFGGWGLRIRSRSESAVVTRSGPALVVTRTDGSALRISLDRPEEPAATITTLLDRRGAQPPHQSPDEALAGER